MVRYSTAFDSSGQVFTETTASAAPSACSWPNKTVGNPNEHKRFVHSQGAATLSSTATRVILTHSGTITAATIATLPWAVARSLWLDVEENQLASARLWCAFAVTFNAEVEMEWSMLENAEYREATAKKAKEQEIAGADLEIANQKTALKSLRRHKTRISHARRYPLEAYLEPLSRLSEKDMVGKWMTVLTLQDVSASRRAMTQGLSGLKNLFCLTIGEIVACDPGHGVDIAIFREWGRHAAEGVPKIAEKDKERHGTPFGMLRVLNLRLQPAITAKLFGYLAPLPLLSVINVDRCGIKEADTEIAQYEGWDLLDVGSTHHLNMSHGWEGLAESGLDFARKRERTSRAVQDHYAIPRLHLLLGNGSMMQISDNFHRGQGNNCYVRDPLTQGKPAEATVLGVKRPLSQGKGTTERDMKKQRRFIGLRENDEVWRGVAASFPI